MGSSPQDRLKGRGSALSPPNRFERIHVEADFEQLECLDDDIKQAVQALPDGHRETVILADLHNMSYKEIAEEMDCPLGTVMSRLHRGRRLLRKSLPQYRPAAACGV